MIRISGGLVFTPCMIIYPSAGGLISPNAVRHCPKLESSVWAVDFLARQMPTEIAGTRRFGAVELRRSSGISEITHRPRTECIPIHEVIAYAELALYQKIGWQNQPWHKIPFRNTTMQPDENQAAAPIELRDPPNRLISDI